MKIERPIIIIGVERSGTTLLYSILSNHPDLYWFSRLDSMLPGATYLATITRRIISNIVRNDIYLAIPNTISRTRGLIPPSECLPYWRKYFKFVDENKNGVKDDDYYSEEDLESHTLKRIHHDLERRLALLGKKRLLLKQPAFSLKIGYFNKLFPDAIFVHVLRHPFTNYDSLYRAKRNSNKKYWGTKFPGWRAYRDIGLEIQSMMHLKEVLEIIERDVHARDGLPERYLIIKYEDLIEKSLDSLTKVITFCGLEWCQEMHSVLDNIARNSGTKVTLLESIEVRKAITPLVNRYGYIVPDNN